jgi:hypothetical protein
LVGVDFDQLETAVVLGLHLLQQWPNDLAGAAPGSPKVHQYGNCLRSGNHFGIEVFYRDIDHGNLLEGENVK